MILAPFLEIYRCKSPLWKPARLFLPSETVSPAVVGDNDPGKCWVHLYLLAETYDVLGQNVATPPRDRVIYRLQEFLVTDDASRIANQVLK